MALSVFGTNLIRLNPSLKPAAFKCICNGSDFPLLRFSAATITSKAFREDKPKPAPYPYKEKNFPIWKSLFDKTLSRFDENSKIIVVEGPVAVGKTKFASQLACELDMHHMEEPNMDLRYINYYGYDMRKLDPQMPNSMKSFDEKNFCQDPFHMNVAGFQMWMLQLRFSLYVDALAHVLSTGQGVVMERSPWSDKVFLEAMFKNKYVSSKVRKAYYSVRDNTLYELMRPHLVIYLDASVNRVKQLIKSRKLCHEQNSKALTDKYLQDIEDVYKTDYLVEISKHAELLIYDWSEEGDVEVIVEDIERLDFTKYTKHDFKLRDWCLWKELQWSTLRRLYADDKQRLMHLFNVPVVDIPELVVPGDEIDAWEKVWYSAEGMKYTEGFNADKGDTGILLKMKERKYVPY